MKLNKKLKGEKEISVRFKKDVKVEVRIYESSGIIDNDGYERLIFKRKVNSQLLQEMVKSLKHK